jgi:hypothetical protein
MEISENGYAGSQPNHIEENIDNCVDWSPFILMTPNLTQTLIISESYYFFPTQLL